MSVDILLYMFAVINKKEEKGCRKNSHRDEVFATLFRQ